MSRRRRGIALAGLALLLGGLAASDVAGREAALRRGLGPLVDVVVARRSLQAAATLRPGDLAVRRVPARFAPAGAFPAASALVGATLGVPLPAGADVTAAALEAGDAAPPGAPVAAGERVAEVVAVGALGAIAPGARVDVLVTRERSAGAPGRTELALQDVEVLAVRAVGGAPGEPAGGRVAAALRVTLRQAVYLAAAQAFAGELRLLARAAGDRRRTRRVLTVGDAL